LVDFGSTDGLKEWGLANFEHEMESGYLKYFYTEELTDWHASIAKNTSHWCAQNEIVVNLDCDNYTGYEGGQFIINRFLQNENIILHQFSGKWGDGSCGRIAVLRKFFDYLGGYDESFEPMGYQDIDLILRCASAGLEYIRCEMPISNIAIKNTKEESICNTNAKIPYSVMNDLNRRKSVKNIDEGILIANNGSYGIRKNVMDYKGVMKWDDSD
jgi:hypothetical protein